MLRHLTFSRIRDAALLIGGLLLIAEETLYAAEPRAILIGLAAGMIGLPATWSANKRFTLPSGLKPTTSEEGPDEPDETPPALTVMTALGRWPVTVLWLWLVGDVTTALHIQGVLR